MASLRALFVGLALGLHVQTMTSTFCRALAPLDALRRQVLEYSNKCQDENLLPSILDLFRRRISAEDNS
jgi:hypothetical protein